MFGNSLTLESIHRHLHYRNALLEILNFYAARLDPRVYLQLFCPKPAEARFLILVRIKANSFTVFLNYVSLIYAYMSTIIQLLNEALVTPLVIVAFEGVCKE